MKLHRRDVFKVAAASAAGLLQVGQVGCNRNSATTEPAAPDSAAATAAAATLQIRLRGLSLLEYQKPKKTLVVHMVDATKFGMPAHEARLRVDLTAVDQDATSLDPDKKENQNSSREAWIWYLSGKTVSILEDANGPDADTDPSTPSGEEPTLGDWKSLKWIPNIRSLTNASMVNPTAGYFVCDISLKHGRLQGEKPKGRVGTVAKWTFKKPASSGGALITRQKFSDTALFIRKLQGRTPVITIGSGKVVLRAGTPGEVAIENAAPPPSTSPGSAITIGHFPLFYQVVNADFTPDYTVDPADLPPCTGCETDPIFCPPTWGGFD